MDQIKDTLNKAAALWQSICGIDPDAKTRNLGNWRLHETFDDLKEAQELDPTQITGALLLAHFVDEYFSDHSVKLLDLLNDPDGVREMLKKPAELMALLGRDEIVRARDSYVKGLTAAVASYGAVERQDVQELLAEPNELAVLRRDALRSMKRLRVDQFLAGETEAAHIRPVYNKTVHQFWNINSLLAAAMRMPSGVSLHLIRHPKSAFQSFFCFLIRNGSRLFIVTDAPDEVHPLQGSMRRRPDRVFSGRASQNWFPYGLVDVDYSEEAERHFERLTSNRTDLVAYQNEALPLKQVSDLEPAELVWLTMMFELLVERFWRQGYEAPQLSYTGEMLKSDRLIEVAKSTNLPAIVHQPLALPALTLADMNSANVTVAEVGKKGHQPNAWMEDRYASSVPEEALNTTASPGDVLLLLSTGEVANVSTESEMSAMSGLKQDAVVSRGLPMKIMDATRFGTREELDADRKFIARTNYAVAIEAKACEEFKARKDEIKAWFHERVRANVQTLASFATDEEVWLDDGIGGTFAHYEKGFAGSVMRDPKSDSRMVRRFMRRVESANENAWSILWEIFAPAKVRDRRYLCVFNDTAPAFHLVFTPAVATDIALLAGCAVDELPDVLRHWSMLVPYVGNSILDRIDPMVWKIDNPWKQIDFQVQIPLSKRAMAKIAKSPRAKPNIPNVCEPIPGGLFSTTF
ncbi:hypothetical protein ABIC83_002389 [Roseateles asaccharophilus]|uniref:hypothetical protein n=1 Tax=Roseateles asaccharophilus TaxID=582607 RepID=UPI0038334071